MTTLETVEKCYESGLGVHVSKHIHIGRCSSMVVHIETNSTKVNRYYCRVRLLESKAGLAKQ